MIQNLLNLSRKTKQILMFLFDVGTIIGSLFVSFYIRLGFWFYPTGDIDLLLAIFAAPLLALPIFIFLGTGITSIFSVCSMR